jgi:serine/threonine protein kinase
MLEAVQEFHSTGKVHRDIKPDNFRVHEGKVYIIDFGNCFEYIKGDRHVDMTSGYAFKGTLWYASVNSHNRYS